MSARDGRPKGLLHDYMELSKARLTALVVFTTGAGYALATRYQHQPFSWPGFLLTVTGTFLAAASANALNQWWEVRRDALMNRTCNRPLPAGRLGSRHALIWALAVGLAGNLLLLCFVNALTAFLALLCQVIYVLAYTPLKPRSTLCTLVGAICGAIPPMMGWAAVTGGLEAGAWILGGILFIWQIPHFLALAWLYRQDYARGGFAMLPVLDETGQATCRMITLYSLVLLAAGPALAFSGTVGWLYAGGSLALGGWFLLRGFQLARDRSDSNARRVFMASVIYLPLLLVLMIADGGHVPVARPVPVSSLQQPATERPADALQISLHEGSDLHG